MISQSSSRWLIAGGAVVVAVIVVVIVVAARRDDKSSAAEAASPTTVSNTSSTAAAGSTPDASAPIDQADAAASAAAAGILPITPTLPVTAEVSNTTGLADGETVSIHVVPDSGSQVFGLEARLCAEGATIQYDADMRPTQTGNCILNPLSANSDYWTEVAAVPPYQVADLDFRVGVGSESFARQDGSDVTITCDASHPCLLAVKVQVPNGFGFLTYPVTFR